MHLTRRVFLQGMAAVGLSGAPRVLLRAAESAASAGGDGVLVVVQLTGGNDGLNTVVPFEEDAYYRSRPVLAIRKSSVLRLERQAPLGVGFHPGLRELKELFDDGHLAVVQGVGYPNPSRSHFRSMDIWHSARPEIEDGSASGWLGRALDRKRQMAALHIGDERLPLALAGGRPVSSIQNLDFIEFLTTRRGEAMRRMLRSLHAPERAGETEAVRRLAASAIGDLEGLIAVRNAPGSGEYPETSLARRLRWAGQLIAARHPARILYLSQDGYDTHAQQADAHAQLLGELSGALAAFYRHVEGAGAAARVAVVVFSEFGRRVEENGSLGTDHGSAAPLLVLSGRARGGLVGEHPSLHDLEGGDLKHRIDFRRVYATLLADVLGVDPEPVLEGRFERLDLLSPVRQA